MKNKKISINKILIFTLFVCICFVSLGYSTLSVSFDIEGSAIFRVDADVRITDVKFESSIDGGYEAYNVKYSKDELISNIVLPTLSSSLTYTLTITNYTTKIMKVENVEDTLSSNNSIKYEINGCNVDDIIPAGSSKNCTVKFYYNTESSINNQSSIIKFSFTELISSDATLADLIVDGYTLSPPFVPEVENYDLILEESSINVNAVVNHEKATVSGSGKRVLTWGINRISLIVTAEDGTNKEYIINVNNVKPSAPVITGGNRLWSTNDQNISIEKEGNALSGIDYYEYYISSLPITPDDETEATGTTTGNLTISDSGTSYVYYRTVSKNGNKSDWSNEEVVNIDKEAPDGNISASASYSDNVATIIFDVNTNDEHSGVNNYLIYYKKSTDNNYLTTTSKSITGISGATYNYYIVVTDNIGYTKTTNVQSIKLKKYGQSGLYCDYTYGDYTSTTTNDVANCTEVKATSTGTTYTKCALGNWSTTPTTTQTNSCSAVAKTDTGTSYTTCTQNSWGSGATTTGESSCTTVARTDTGTSYTTCTLDSDWTKLSSTTTTSCSASESTTSKITCSKSSTVASTTYATSCSSSNIVTCTSGYYQAVCRSGSPRYGTSSCATQCSSYGGYAACYSGYYKKVTYKYTKTTSAKYYTKVVYNRDYAFTKNVYNRFYNEIVYTREKTANTCWYDE